MEAAKNRFVKVDGSGDLLPGKRQVRSLRAGVGSSIATHRVRMTIYEDRRYRDLHTSCPIGPKSVKREP